MSSRLSISQITTVSAPFDADLDAYRAAGAHGIGIWEFKLAEDSARAVPAKRPRGGDRGAGRALDPAACR